MDFRTELSVPASQWRIDHSMAGFFVGSCFSDEIARRMSRLKYRLCANPLGAMYNPLSVVQCVERVAERRLFTASEVESTSERWFTTDADTTLSGRTRQEAVTVLNEAVNSAATVFADSTYVVLTLGTNYVYSRNGAVVANCQKLPSSQFERRAMCVDECVEALRGLVGGVLHDKRVVITVSPIRHIKDGLSESSLSKAVLRVAAARVAESCDNAVYFPSFEILVDELRDYRFYADDMVHPSKSAVDYISQKFFDAFLDPSEAELNARIEAVVVASEHRPFDESSAEYRRFLEVYAQKTHRLQQQCRWADLSREQAFFKRFL